MVNWMAMAHFSLECSCGAVMMTTDSLNTSIEKVICAPCLMIANEDSCGRIEGGLDTALPFWVSVLQVLTMLLTKHLRMTICLKHSSVGYAVALLLWSADIQKFMTACAHCVESSESSGLNHLDRLTCRLAIKGLKMHQLNISNVGWD